MFLSTAKKNIHAAARATRSFTLIELLVSIGILVVLVSITVISLGAYKGRTSFNLDASQIVALLRNAQSRAVSQDRGQGWGVKFTNSTTTGGQYALFWGTSYATSSVVTAGTLGYSSFFTDPAPGFSKTIVFAPVTGAPDGPDVVVIKNSTTATVAIITISALGLVGQTTESGLVGYWPMDEGVESTTTDASGNGNAGLLMNGPTWVAGEAGWSLSFDGVDDQVNLPDVGVMSTGTYSLWIRPVSISASQGWIDSNFDIFGWTGSVAYFRAGNQSSVSIAQWSPGTWHHIAMTWNGSVYAGYLDGALVATGTQSGVRTGALYLGRVDAGYFFAGQIDDVRIYNRALSATEIKNLFNSY